MKFWQDKKFMKAMIAVALPITLQNLITSSLNMVDTLMISNLGQSSIAAVGMSYGTALRSVGRPQIPMKLSAISFVVNTVFNYFLIFGKFGFPALGVKGAAMATLLARFIEVSLLLFVVYREATSPLAANLNQKNI